MTDDQTATSDMRVATPAEVARLLRVPRNRVYRMVADGELPVLRRVGSEIRFDLDAIEQWLRTPQEEIPPPGPDNRVRRGVG